MGVNTLLIFADHQQVGHLMQENLALGLEVADILLPARGGIQVLFLTVQVLVLPEGAAERDLGPVVGVGRVRRDLLPVHGLASAFHVRAADLDPTAPDPVEDGPGPPLGYSMEDH